MSTPAGRRPIVVVAVGAGLLAIASPAVPAGVNAEYRELVARYARGERALAIAGVARFSDSELGRIAQTVEAAALAAERSKAAERVKDREQGKETTEPPSPCARP